MSPAFSRLRSAPRPLSGSASAGEEQPFRSELYSVGQLREHAQALAGWHKLAARPGPDRLLGRLTENEAFLLETHALLEESVRNQRRIAPAGEWLIDNHYLVLEQIRMARRHLPRSYSGELPQLASGPLAGYPRVYDLVLEMISHADGRLDLESLSAFIASYQAVSPLKLGELWAVPIMLRLALVENLRRVAARVVSERRDQERASFWADRLIGVSEQEMKGRVLVLAEMVEDAPPLSSAFVAELFRRLQDQGPGLAFPLAWLEQSLSERGRTVEQLVLKESQNQAADQVSVGNSITSLRFLSTRDWRDFVESMSAVERALRRDPSGVYGRMDFVSRDLYRHVVEEIAHRSPLPEQEIAVKAVQLARAQAARGGGERRGHVGYFLVDRGRPELERAVGMRPTLRMRWERLGRRFPVAAYLSATGLLTALPSAAVLWKAWELGLRGLPLAGLGLAVVLAASQLAVVLVNWLATLRVGPRPLPKLQFPDGLSSEQRTMVVVPTMLTSPRGIEQLLQGLEVRFLANRDPHLHFALLTDFADAPEKSMPGDAELLRLAKEGIERLNARHCPEEGDGFFLFHRPRLWNERERTWMGRERKRGKLEDFNALLRGEAEGCFETVVGRTDLLRGVEYVITLDTDTGLPQNAGREMIGAMAHPLNQARFDPERGRVVEGYGILQPRVGIDLPSASRSRFAALFSADAGVDPYTREVSDVYQDLFGEGSFVGKGIYHVDTFREALRDRLPDNRILSHDLIEGCFTRSGLLSDVVLYEDSPASYLAGLSRRHRWLRGDWQIASWLLPWVPGPGRRRSNPLTLLARWKIFDNLRRSLVPVALLGLVGAGLAVPSLGATLALLVAAVLLAPALCGALGRLLRKPSELPWRMQLGELGSGLWRQLAQALLALACLPAEALNNLDAIARASWRVHLSRRRLLEWRTASEAERSARRDLAGYYIAMAAAPLSAVAAGAALAFWPGTPTPWPLLPLLVAWAFAPLLAWWLSRPTPPRLVLPTAEDQRLLHNLARRTWGFFETLVDAQGNYLPPDSIQEKPAGAVFYRTSPTNIGLALLANLGAHDLGYLSTGRLIERTSDCLDTLERMERYRGHFFNWYDTRTLEPLPPHYISSVDSGNLVGHMLTLAAGLEGAACRGEALAARSPTSRSSSAGPSVASATHSTWRSRRPRGAASAPRASRPRHSRAWRRACGGCSSRWRPRRSRSPRSASCSSGWRRWPRGCAPRSGRALQPSCAAGTRRSSARWARLARSSASWRRGSSSLRPAKGTRCKAWAPS